MATASRDTLFPNDWLAAFCLAVLTLPVGSSMVTKP